jgi:hypothetical protein
MLTCMNRLPGKAGRTAGIVSTVAALIVMGPLALRAQEASLRAERTVDYKPGQAATVNAKVGSVNVLTVEFSERSHVTGGLSTVITGGTYSETVLNVRAHIVAENPTDKEWEVNFTIEYLDKDGKLIDRVSKKGSWEGQSKALDIDHPLLSYVFPLIAQVRIKMEAKLD